MRALHSNPRAPPRRARSGALRSRISRARAWARTLGNGNTTHARRHARNHPILDMAVRCLAVWPFARWVLRRKASEAECCFGSSHHSGATAMASHVYIWDLYQARNRDSVYGVALSSSDSIHLVGCIANRSRICRLGGQISVQDNCVTDGHPLPNSAFENGRSPSVASHACSRVQRER